MNLPNNLLILRSALTDITYDNKNDDNDDDDDNDNNSEKCIIP